ncbi:MAG TPA: dihydroorotase [Microscillaceae bacterium]|nr:dihydroorotase [Microscillaceae bacterium]
MRIIPANQILIQNVLLIDPFSPWHRQYVNLALEQGYICQVSPVEQDLQISLQNFRIFPANGLSMTIGWFDLGAHFQDPGNEHKETLTSGCQAATQGGFTEVALLPNTQPVIAHKQEVAYILQHNQPSQIVKVHPLAAVTQDTAGKELTEMIDLIHAGAVGFTDGSKPLWNTDILLKTLQYLQPWDALLLNRPEDTWLAQLGQMHEGIQSTFLGLKGIPALAETLMVERDINLLRYAGGKLHFTQISASDSLPLIAQAKQAGLSVSADVSALHLTLTDENLHQLDTACKISPPLRSHIDREALWQALANHTLDVICSGHHPQDEESKNLEFDLADFGAIGLETFFGSLNTYAPQWLLEDAMLAKFTSAPRQLLRQPLPALREGEKANFTLFDPQKIWTVNEQTIFSRSKNSPFWGQQLQGKAVAVCHNGLWAELD